jgi:hypothetical protein
MSRRVAKQLHSISMSYAGFHQTAAAPRDMKRDINRRKYFFEAVAIDNSINALYVFGASGVMWAMATLSEIARATGAKPRAIQLWADAGVIIADPGTDREGSGKHRKFDRGEVIVACIIAPFAADKMAIGGLLKLSQVVRNLMKVNARAFDLAAAGTGKGFLAVSLRHFFPANGTLRPLVRIIESFEANGPLFEIMEKETPDFPLVKILSLKAVLGPLKTMKF